ncbi:MAG: hypothetical protein WBM09_02420 [Gallionella sp.]
MKGRPFIFQHRRDQRFLVCRICAIQLVEKRRQQYDLLVYFCDLLLRFLVEIVSRSGFLEAIPIIEDLAANFLELVARTGRRHLVKQYPRHPEANFLDRTIHFLQRHGRLHLVFVNVSQGITALVNAIHINGGEHQRSDDRHRESQHKFSHQCVEIHNLAPNRFMTEIDEWAP